MRVRESHHRQAPRRAAVIRRISLTILTAGVVAAVAVAGAQAAPAHRHVGVSGSAYLHRHGVVPERGGLPALNRLVLGATTNALDLSYQGAAPGAGVVTGPPRVYLVFYGSQWGTQSTTTLNGTAYASFSGDPKAMAPTLQAYFAGLGTNHELWSGVMTQYCESTATVTVAVGASTCPTGAAHVRYPGGSALGGALQGVWEDTSVASPSTATQVQLATEAEAAAAHFGNTTTAASRNAVYFIVSPTGTHADGFNTVFGNFCAWHSSTAGTSGSIDFTNLPYIPDIGASCGANFVNSGSAGALDGVTIVGGHEYAETLTDQFPAGGWYNSTYGENGDLCGWNANGGVSADVTLATGAFAVQPTWGNDANGSAGGCALSRAIFATNTVTVTTPGAQTATAGTAVAPVGITATDTDTTQALTYSATGLPAGLSINPSGGMISGTPTGAAFNAPVTVTVTDPTGASGSASFTWTVSNAGGNTITVTNPGNKTSAQGVITTPFTISATDNQANQTLTYVAAGLPTGLSINSTSGAVSGTPTVGVTNQTVTVTVTDSTGATGTTSFTWTVTVPNTVTVTNPGSQTTPTATTVSLSIFGTDSGALALTYSATGLPGGLQINPTTGVISGITGTSAATFSVTVTAKDSTNASGSVSFLWAVTAHKVTVINPGNQTTLRNSAVSMQIAATDSAAGARLTYSVSGLPTGLSISSSTGAITGRPTRRGTRSVTLTVRDATGAKGTAAFAWTIN